MYKILLIEDVEESKNLVAQALGPAFELFWAQNLKKASKLIEEQSFDLILLDVELPDGDGFKFLSLLLNAHRFNNIPIIFLTSKNSVSDKVLGFSLGADDYIVKPFEPQEFRARLEMRLKKFAALQKQTQIIQKGCLELNLASLRAFECIDGEKKDLGLTPLEFKILNVLAINEDHIFSRAKLLDKVWGANAHLTDRCVDTHVYTLRKKLGKLSTYIQAVYGEGYRFSHELASTRRGGKTS